MDITLSPSSVSVTIFHCFSQKSLQQIWQKCLEKNISETNESFESKFGGNVHWMVLYKMDGYFMCRSEIVEGCHPKDILKHRTL